jgi:hypothetical protein
MTATITMPNWIRILLLKLVSRRLISIAWVSG